MLNIIFISLCNILQCIDYIEYIECIDYID